MHVSPCRTLRAQAGRHRGRGGGEVEKIGRFFSEEYDI
jgi:hypothetical protein